MSAQPYCNYPDCGCPIDKGAICFRGYPEKDSMTAPSETPLTMSMFATQADYWEAEADKQKHMAAHWENLAAKYKAERNEASHWLGELLAIIHRDGGHYLAEHGTEKATKDAIEKVYELRAECERLREDACNTIKAMSDEQIKALSRLEGHDPADTAKIVKQSMEIAMLKVSLSAAESREREAYERAAVTAWTFFMDWRKQHRTSPAEHNDLFELCRKIRALADERRE